MADLRLPNQPLKNAMYILPDFIMKEELLDVKVQPPQAMKLENLKDIEPIVRVKQELLNVEAPHQSLTLEDVTEIFPTIAVKEDLLDIKDESEYLHDLVISAEDRDELNTDNENINLRAGSDENPTSLCEGETLGNYSVSHKSPSPDSAMQLSLNIKSSSLSDSQIPCVNQYSRHSVKKRMCKKGNMSTIHSTEMQTKLHETITRNRPIFQNEFHTSKKSLRCNAEELNSSNTCQESFPTPFRLKTHFSTQRARNSYTCDTCHKCFRLLSELKTHTRIHTGSKPYICDTCHKCFSRLGNLKTHTSIHTGSKPYTCDTCHKSFNQLSSLNSHTRIHTGSKPYICDTCHKCFSQLASLKLHTRIHTGSKPYTCDTCHKCFSRLSSLELHIRIHTGSKPYTCDTCHKCFSQLGHLRTHTSIHTGSKPYTCDTCHKCYRLLSHLKSHTRIHTGT